MDCIIAEAAEYDILYFKKEKFRYEVPIKFEYYEPSVVNKYYLPFHSVKIPNKIDEALLPYVDVIFSCADCQEFLNLMPLQAYKLNYPYDKDYFYFYMDKLVYKKNFLEDQNSNFVDNFMGLQTCPGLNEIDTGQLWYAVDLKKQDIITDRKFEIKMEKVLRLDTLFFNTEYTHLLNTYNYKGLCYDLCNP